MISYSMVLEFFAHTDKYCLKQGGNLMVGGEIRNKVKDIRDQVTRAVKATVILNFTLESDGSL